MRLLLKCMRYRNNLIKMKTFRACQVSGALLESLECDMIGSAIKFTSGHIFNQQSWVNVHIHHCHQNGKILRAPKFVTGTTGVP